MAFLMWLSSTGLLSWRASWWIKWCWCHKAEFDLHAKRWSSPSHVQWQDERDCFPLLGSQNLLSKYQFAVPWTKKVVYSMRKKTLTTLNFSARILFLHHTDFFHILPFMSCHNEKQRGRSYCQRVLKARYGGKSWQLCGCITSGTWSLERAGGWTQWLLKTPHFHPPCLSATCSLQGTVSLTRQVDGNIQPPRM